MHWLFVNTNKQNQQNGDIAYKQNTKAELLSTIFYQLDL